MAMLPRLQAQEDLRQIRVLQAGSGVLKKTDFQKVVDDLRQQAFPERQRARTLGDLVRHGFIVTTERAERG